jgi:hypothetical protein
MPEARSFREYEHAHFFFFTGTGKANKKDQHNNLLNRSGNSFKVHMEGIDCSEMNITIIPILSLCIAYTMEF